ncbi:MAG: hypothetical protein JWP97_2983 [Labilithrix sp.]|nr:hypothetical protein [Labilithrix sp.]
MRTASLLTVAALAAAPSLAFLAGCSSNDDAKSPGEPPMASSQQARITSPSVPAADADALRDGNAAFATDLYKELTRAPAAASSNVFFSPYSISLALAMTYAGARGTTASQLATGMHFTLPAERLHPAFDALDLALTARGENAAGSDGQPFRLRVVNSMWGAPETTFAPTFLDTLAESYGAGVRLTDFASDPEASRKTINEWTSTQTEARIKELLPAGSIQNVTRFVLVNAIYFNAAWKTPFEKESTAPGTFHGVNGDVTTDLMHRSGTLAYAHGDGYQAIALPYDGDELSFVAVLPDALGAFEAGFSADQASGIAAALAPTENVALTLPSFEIKGATVSLKDVLAARGITDAFSPEKADFSGISATEKLWISDVVHQAFVAVKEKGTEAAAATAVIGAGSAAAPQKTIDVSFDKPFVFFVRDNATGAILFLGRYVSAK